MGQECGEMRKGGGRLFRAAGRWFFGLTRGGAGSHVFCGKMGRGKGQWREDRISLRRAKTRRLGKFFPRLGVFFRRLGKIFRCLPVFSSSRQSVRPVAGGGGSRGWKKAFPFLPYKNKGTKKGRLPNPMRGSGSRPSRLDTIFFTYYLLLVYGVVGGLFVARTAHKYQYVINQCSQRAEGSHYVSVGG